MLPATSAPSPDRVPAPAPPNGTYTYALSRNGGTQGTATVVIYRRDDRREIETDEAGAAGAVRMAAVASYRYADLGVETYTGTYQAPFLRGSPLGRTYKNQTVPDFGAQLTVRYRSQPGALVASIDGTAIADTFPVPARAKGAARDPWILDGPFMTGALLLPAFRHRSGEPVLAPVSEAFPVGIDAAPQRLVRAAASFPKTPKNDLAIDVPGVVRVWFDPATYIVHEAHFTALNFDARLVSYVKPGRTATYFAQPPAAPEPALPRELTTFTSGDGTELATVLARPVATVRASPAIVLLAPGPGAALDYSGDGPHPMFPALAAALVARGYAVLRYDMRGIGKSGGSRDTETWDQARADAQAALTSVASDPTLDPKRTYLLGYGNGADLALAAAASTDVRVTGVVALAPTVLAYRSCAAAVEQSSPGRMDAWRKSSLAHDPTVLAARATMPLLILHPGDPVCGETRDQIDAYDERVRSGNSFATIVVASDLSARFGGRYEAESPVNTEAFFPYRFDASTATAIADWLDNPKTRSAANTLGVPAGSAGKTLTPPAPPGIDRSGSGLPNPHLATPKPASSVQPGGRVTVR